MHSAHDYRRLVQRWRSVARRVGRPLVRLATIGRTEVYSFSTSSLGASGGIYLSAGIHGDEPAATEALITWAEEEAPKLDALPLFILPCLNPWGLAHNCRASEAGEDLNRLFHRDDHPLIHAIKSAVAGRCFALSLTLHEDYDGQGVYLYEIQRQPPFWGEALLEAARPGMPIDGRTAMDGRKAASGVIRRRFDRRIFARIGYPEAIWLHLEHSERTFTVETPSEFALPQRVAAHVAIIRECVRMGG